MREKQIRLNFEKRFMQKIYSKDKELNEFLVRNFYIVNRNKVNWRDRFKKFLTKDYTTKRHTQHEVDRKVNLLKQLTDGEKKVAKSRLKQFEEDNDPSKYVGGIISFTTGFAVSVFFLLEVISDDGWNVLFSSGILLLYVLAIFKLTKSSNYRTTAIYCNSLLEDVLTVEKETIIKDDK